MLAVRSVLGPLERANAGTLAMAHTDALTGPALRSRFTAATEKHPATPAAPGRGPAQGRQHPPVAGPGAGPERLHRHGAVPVARPQRRDAAAEEARKYSIIIAR